MVRRIGDHRSEGTLFSGCPVRGAAMRSPASRHPILHRVGDPVLERLVRQVAHCVWLRASDIDIQPEYPSLLQVFCNRRRISSTFIHQLHRAIFECARKLPSPLLFWSSLCCHRQALSYWLVRLSQADSLHQTQGQAH